MKYEYIEVDLDSDQKKIILELAAIYIDDDFTKADLNNGRRNGSDSDHMVFPLSLVSYRTISTGAKMRTNLSCWMS